MRHPVLLVSPEAAGEGGIGDFAAGLNRALLEAGTESRTSVHLPSASREATSIHALNYQPYLYGWQGLSPRLVYWAARPHQGSAVRVLIAHELFSTGSGKLARVRELLQRQQLLRVAQGCEVLLATCEQWANLLQELTDRSVGVLPVGSNIEPHPQGQAAGRAEWRRKRGVQDDELVLLEFGRHHESKSGDAIDRSLAAVASNSPAPVQHVIVGSGARRRFTDVPGVERHELGWLPQDEVSRVLFGSDLLLAPFVDGLSARRTSVVSAYAHQLAVASNAEPGTDSWLQDLGCPGIDGMPDWAVALSEPRARESLVERQSEVYRSRLTWTAIRQRFETALEFPP